MRRWSDVTLQLKRWSRSSSKEKSLSMPKDRATHWPGTMLNLGLMHTHFLPCRLGGFAPFWPPTYTCNTGITHTHHPHYIHLQHICNTTTCCITQTERTVHIHTYILCNTKMYTCISCIHNPSPYKRSVSILVCVLIFTDHPIQRKCLCLLNTCISWSILDSQQQQEEEEGS